MARRTESALGLVPVVKSPDAATGRSLSLYGDNRKLTQAEQRTVNEYHKQKLVITATAAKGILIQEKLEELADHNEECFVTLLQRSRLRLEGSCLNGEDRAKMEEFVTYNHRLHSRNTFGTVDVIAGALADVADRSLYFADEIKRHNPSLWQKLFGGGNGP